MQRITWSAVIALPLANETLIDPSLLTAIAVIAEPRWTLPAGSALAIATGRFELPPAMW